MIKKRKFPKIFFGWWTVLAGGFLNLWGFGFYYSGMSALFKPLASELGFSRAGTSVAASIGRLEGGFEAPVTGWATDRFGPRWVVFWGVFLIGLGLILMKYINSLWAYYVVWGIIAGTGVNTALALPFDKAIANWFVKKRGLAMGIKWAFSGLSGVLVLPLVAWLISIQDWRMACFTGGMVMWLIGLPLVWLFVRQHRPEYYGLLPDGASVPEEVADTSQMIERGIEYAAEVQEVEFTLRQAMRTLTYWLLTMANGIHFMVVPVISMHFMPLLTDMGVEPVKAAVMMAIMNAVGVPARLVSGLLCDRVKRSHMRFLLGGAYLLQAAGVTIFLLNQTVGTAYVFLLIYRLGLGMGLPLNTVIGARYFGRKGFGSIRGSSMIFMTPLGVIAPIYAGWVYDTTGNYIPAFTLFAGLLALSAVLMWLCRPPEPPTEVTDISKFL